MTDDDSNNNAWENSLPELRIINNFKKNSFPAIQ